MFSTGRIVKVVLLFLSTSLGTRGADMTSRDLSFKDKTITMIVGYTAGGSTDLVARLVGNYLVKYLPGSPKLIVQNMPGAEGVNSINYLVKQTAKDGLTIAAAAAAQIDPLFLPTAHAAYHPIDLNFIGGTGRPGSVLVLNKSAESRLFTGSTGPATMGATAAVRSAMQMVIWGGEYLRWNVKWIVGYPGSTDLKLALERGEIDMTTLASDADTSEIMKTGRFEIVLQTGFLQDGQIRANKEYGNAPLFDDLLAGKVADPLAQQALAYTDSMTQIGQWFGLPPGTPEPIVAAYREAYQKVFADPQFLKEINAMTPGILNMGAKDVTLLVQRLSNTSPGVLGYMQGMATKQGLQLSP